MSAAETWLSPEEVGELTGLKPNSYKAQCRRLAMMGIPFRPNAIGRPLVQRDTVLDKPKKAKAWKGPNWDAIDGKAA